MVKKILLQYKWRNTFTYILALWKHLLFIFALAVMNIRPLYFELTNDHSMKPTWNDLAKSLLYIDFWTLIQYIYTHIHFLGTESLIKLTWIFWIDPPVNEMQRLFVMSHYKLALQKWIIQACQKLIWIFSRSCDCRKKLKSFKNHNIFYLKIYLYANMFYCEQRL